MDFISFYGEKKIIEIKFSDGIVSGKQISSQHGKSDHSSSYTTFDLTFVYNL